MPIISLTMTVDGRDGADYDGGKSADADGDDANNDDDQHTNRENFAVTPVNSNHDNDGRKFYMRRM